MNTQTRVKLDHFTSFFLSLAINAFLLLALTHLLRHEPPPATEEFTIRYATPEERVTVEDPPDPILNEPKVTESPDDPIAPPDPYFERVASLDDPFESRSEELTPPVDTRPLTTDTAGILQVDWLTPTPRDPRERARLLEIYTPDGGDTTEPAVARALAWLASVQKEDGSWDKDGNPGTGRGNAGHTGLALLTFLSSGITPGHAEYGATVSRAIRYLVESQQSGGLITGGGREVYAHPIATYALAEAYTLTGNLVLAEPLERAAGVMIRNQMAGGGFPGSGNDGYRYGGGGANDGSVTAWHVQSLKAVRIAATEHGLNLPGLDQALVKSMEGMLEHARDHERGLTLGYTSPGTQNIITAAGALGMHLTGFHRRTETRRLLSYTHHAHNPPAWGRNTIGNEYGGSINHWYYAVQAFFHQNPRGREFQTFYAGMSAALVENQHAEGYWVDFHDRGQSQGKVYGTTLGALSLMVTYRYLPTTQAERIQTRSTPTESPRGNDDLVEFLL